MGTSFQSLIPLQTPLPLNPLPLGKQIKTKPKGNHPQEEYLFRGKQERPAHTGDTPWKFASRYVKPYRQKYTIFPTLF